MAEIVLAIGASHGPSIQSEPERWAKLADGDTRDPRFDYQELLAKAKPGLDTEITIDIQRQRHAAAQRGLACLHDLIVDANPDVCIVVSNIHRVRPADHHPVFGIYTGESMPVKRRSDEPFDPDARFRPELRSSAISLVDRPANSALATHILRDLIESQFDIACMDRLPEGTAMDDAFTFCYNWIFRDKIFPLLPFMVSRDLPNQATARRCHDLGRALRKAIESWPQKTRVALIASGGLSHQIIDEDLDRKVIGALTTGDAETLKSIPRDRLNIGPGTPEILNWVTVAAAMDPSKMTLVDYLPCYRSLAGTGHGVTFGYWK